jgi:hypothetical protein
VETFLKACGSRVEELDFKGFANFADVFSNAPNLREVQWDPWSLHAKYHLALAAAFSPSAAHEKLERFTLKRIPDAREYRFPNSDV